MRIHYASFSRRIFRHLNGNHGRDAQVRIRTDWLFEARHGRGLSYLEFAVLVAIYSKIGRKKGPVRITRDEIWRRAHGYKSKIVFDQMVQNGPFRFTKWQVRAAIEGLHDARFLRKSDLWPSADLLFTPANSNRTGRVCL